MDMAQNTLRVLKKLQEKKANQVADIRKQSLIICVRENERCRTQTKDLLIRTLVNHHCATGKPKHPKHEY